jgi:hypothetical protein
MVAVLQVSMVWAVSQASPLRRVVVDGVLNLFECDPSHLFSLIIITANMTTTIIITTIIIIPPPFIQIQQRRRCGLRLRRLHRRLHRCPHQLRFPAAILCAQLCRLFRRRRVEHGVRGQHRQLPS